MSGINVLYQCLWVYIKISVNILVKVSKRIFLSIVPNDRSCYLERYLKMGREKK